MSCSLEIGGYFELERFSGHHYHENAIALNCGRGCLAYLIELRAIKSVWVPDWICDSVPEVFIREGVAVKRYAVGEDFLPTYDFEIGAEDWLLLVDYYGQLDQADIDKALGNCRGRLIVDETQGFFRSPWIGCDTVYSTRKWFGVSDGGYLATSDGKRLERTLPTDESHDRMSFVLGRFERPAGEFYGEASENNHVFRDEPAKEMSPITTNLLRAVDYDAVSRRRNGNWEVLSSALTGINKLSLKTPDAPFMYPLMIDDARQIREKLINEKVFVPVLWPDVLNKADSTSWAYRFASEILPLPIDQRYGEQEMDRMLTLLEGAGVFRG